MAYRYVSGPKPDPIQAIADRCDALARFWWWDRTNAMVMAQDEGNASQPTRVVEWCPLEQTVGTENSVSAGVNGETEVKYGIALQGGFRPVVKPFCIVAIDRLQHVIGKAQSIEMPTGGSFDELIARLHNSPPGTPHRGTHRLIASI